VLATVICVAGIAALLFGLRFATHKIAATIPFSLERRLFGEVGLQIPGLEACEAPAVITALGLLAQQLSTPHEQTTLPLTFEIFDWKLPNAFALLGGRIIFTSGFLKDAGSLDEIAGVLAHEMEHVAQRHVLTHMLDAFSFSLLMRPFSGSEKLNPAVLTALLQLKFSREDEASADAGAAARLDRAGFSRQGIADFFNRVDGKDLKLPVDVSFLSSHPKSEDRVKAFLVGSKPASKNPTPQRRQMYQVLKQACD